MIVTTLIFLAATQSEVSAVAKRYEAFMAAHPTFSADCALSGWGGTGKGTITIRRPASGGVKVDWIAKSGALQYRFTTDASMGIEVSQPDFGYDRLPAFNRPFPTGRINNPFGFPFPLVAGRTPFSAPAAAKTVVTHKGNITELVLTLHSPLGDTVITGDFARDGRLTHYDAGKGQRGHLSHEIEDITNYRFGAKALPSAFETNPPIGGSPYAFDTPPDVLAGTEPLPAVPLSGAQATTLAKLGTQPKLLIVFVDDLMPDGLLASLGRLNNQTPVVAIALNGAEVEVGSLPLYRTDEAGFDAAGVRAMPQFYYVSEGKVVQAWLGFRESAAAKFEAGVLSYVNKP